MTKVWVCPVFFIYLGKNWFSRVSFFCISLSIDLWWNFFKSICSSYFFLSFFFFLVFNWWFLVISLRLKVFHFFLNPKKKGKTRFSRLFILHSFLCSFFPSCLLSFSSYYVKQIFTYHIFPQSKINLSLKLNLRFPYLWNSFPCIHKHVQLWQDLV